MSIIDSSLQKTEQSQCAICHQTVDDRPHVHSLQDWAIFRGISTRPAQPRVSFYRWRFDRRLETGSLPEPINYPPEAWLGRDHNQTPMMAADWHKIYDSLPPRIERLPSQYRGVFDYPTVQSRLGRFGLPSESAIIEVREEARRLAAKMWELRLAYNKSHAKSKDQTYEWLYFKSECETFDNLVEAADICLDALKVLRDPASDLVPLTHKDVSGLTKAAYTERGVIKHKGESLPYKRAIVRRPVGLPHLNETVPLDIYLRAITPPISSEAAEELLLGPRKKIDGIKEHPKEQPVIYWERFWANVETEGPNARHGGSIFEPQIFKVGWGNRVPLLTLEGPSLYYGSRFGQRFVDFIHSLPAGPHDLEYQKPATSFVDEAGTPVWAGEEGDGTDANGKAEHRSVRTDMMPDYEGEGYHASPSSAQFRILLRDLVKIDHTKPYEDVVIPTVLFKHVNYSSGGESYVVSAFPVLTGFLKPIYHTKHQRDCLVVESADAVERYEIHDYAPGHHVFPVRQTPSNYLALQPDQKTQTSVTYVDGKCGRFLLTYDDGGMLSEHFGIGFIDADSDGKVHRRAVEHFVANKCIEGIEDKAIEDEAIEESVDDDYEAVTTEVDSADEETMTEQALGGVVESVERIIVPDLSTINQLHKDPSLNNAWWYTAIMYPKSGPEPVWPKASLQLLPRRGYATKEEWAAQNAWEDEWTNQPEVEQLKHEENEIWKQYDERSKRLNGKWDESLYDLFMQITNLRDKQNALTIEAALDGLFRVKGVWHRDELTMTRETTGDEEEKKIKNIDAATKHPMFIALFPTSALSREDVLDHMLGRLSTEEFLTRNPGATADALYKAEFDIRKGAAKVSDPKKLWREGLSNAGISPNDPGIFAFAHFPRAEERVYKIADIGNSDEVILKNFDDLVTRLAEQKIKNKRPRPQNNGDFIRLRALERGSKAPTNIVIARREIYDTYAHGLTTPLLWRVQPLSESQEPAILALKLVLLSLIQSSLKIGM